GGGLERNTHELCLRLQRGGFTPAVICNLQPDRSVLALRNRIARKLRPSVRFPMDRGLGYPVFRGWGDDDGAAEVAARFRPDVVVVQSTGHVPILQSFRALGVPCVAYFHDLERVDDAREIAAMGDVALLANSRFTASRMAERIGYECPVIRPLIDPALYRTRMHPQNVLFINPQAWKGVDVAFELARRRPDVRFDFVGNWNLKPPQVRALAERAHAAGNVILHPPTNDVRPHYARARLLLAPSQWV